MKVHIVNRAATLTAQPGENLLKLLQRHGLVNDAPCGGKGTCGKCRVTVDGKPALACKTTVGQDMEVILPETARTQILAKGLTVQVQPDGTDPYTLAFDVGTTTVVAYLLDGGTGKLLAQSSCINPQTRFGADVISRIQYAMNEDSEAVSSVLKQALADLTQKAARAANISPGRITTVSLVGNTAMHHLLLGIDPKPLTIPPYMPKVSEALEIPADFLPVSPKAVLRVLPNIAGFVGADTVGCLVATRFDQLEELTLMIDIGTNGEMVLGNRDGFLACSTAAGPAFEGAKIACGMRGAMGAVDHVWMEDGQVCWNVIGGGEAKGLCGSGLLDLVAVLLESEVIDESGRMEEKIYHLGDTQVFLTQKDVREVQLAKAAIRAGIELMCQKRGTKPADIQKVYLAGAFGNYMDPVAACAIGLIPPVLQERIEPIGNAAGEGAKLCALSAGEFAYSKLFAEKAKFLELASMPEFNDCYVDCLLFEEDE